MKFLVCISNVPDTTTKISFTENSTQFNTTGVQYILNPYDELAMARALELAEGKAQITVLHVGGAAADPTIRKALALGADAAVRVNAPALDAQFVAAQIAAVARSENFDLIFFGRESIDYNGAGMCSLVAALLGIPSISIVRKLDLEGTKVKAERDVEGGKEVLESSLPLAVSCSEGIAEAKIPNMRGIMSARTKPLKVVESVAFPEETRIVAYELPVPRGKVSLIDALTAGDLILRLHDTAKVI